MSMSLRKVSLHHRREQRRRSAREVRKNRHGKLLKLRAHERFESEEEQHDCSELEATNIRAGRLQH